MICAVEDRGEHAIKPVQHQTRLNSMTYLPPISLLSSLSMLSEATHSPQAFKMATEAARLPVGKTNARLTGHHFMPHALPSCDEIFFKSTSLDTQHVPCKFFLQGQCQAGQTCPFSHDIESTTRPTPCKYFAKGGCKFGRKCALLHITADGMVVNRMPPAQYSQQGYTNGAQGQPLPGDYGQPPPGLLSMQAQALEARQNATEAAEYGEGYPYGSRNGHDMTPVDMTYTSASPQYGSPPHFDAFGASPTRQGLSVLDAPLPSSFDSNGISLAARNGPFASSVPVRFGLESPPSSLPQKSHLGNTALRDLHNSAFGSQGMDGLIASMGSSPPSGTDEPFTFDKRPLHSARLRAPRGIVSASLGTRLPTQAFEYSDDEDEDHTDREEDLLPASLRDLIPDGRSRRESRTRAEEDYGPAAFLAAQRRTISGTFSGFGGFGHVGSPLRNSGFAYSQSPSNRASSNGDLSPNISSPPRQTSMSVLTQELQRTKLDAARSQQVSGAPTVTRTVSNGSHPGRASLDRGASNTSVGKIDEEQDLFDMEEIVSAASATTPRSSGGPVPASTSRGAWDHKLQFGSASPGTGGNGFGVIGAPRSSAK
nr:zinc finger protein lee1 [Quercus suber]